MTNFNRLIKFIFICFAIHKTKAIGEGVLDVNALLGIVSGLGNIFKDLNTTDISIDRLLGKWHQMYKAAINFDVFQTNMYCQIAYFTRNKVMGRDGFSIEEAFHVVAKNGPIEVYKRDVTKTGTGEYWMYTEEYFYPRQFFILKAGPDDHLSNSSAPYDYLIASDSNRLALMVFARDPQTFHDLYDRDVQEFLAKQGFGGYVFWNQPIAIYQGADCYYPSEQEVFARRVVKGTGNNQLQHQQQLLQPGLATAFGGAGDDATSALGTPWTAGQQQALLAQQRSATDFNARQLALLNARRLPFGPAGAPPSSAAGGLQQNFLTSLDANPTVQLQQLSDSLISNDQQNQQRNSRTVNVKLR
uniref:Uncharacterized protein n=1 Tax=Romanomermis culicivorax TaxID=13658 RepID=A0A915KFU1_ROMCU